LALCTPPNFESRPPPSAPFGYEAEDSPYRRPGADAPGMISLVFGCVAGVMLLMGVITCGVTVYVALPLALIGTILPFFGRGNLRVGALTLNLLVFVLSLVAVMVMVVAFAAASAR
jgi:hypothetical protein